jgi:hypothetical protein
VVTSKEKISLREPAAALPSSLSLSSIALTSSESEAFDLHAPRVFVLGVSGMTSMTSPRRQAILVRVSDTL